MSSPPPFRIGVLGLHHDHVWSELRHAVSLHTVDLAGAADPDPELRERFHREFHRPVHSGYDAILQDDSVAAVFVFASNRAGAELATRAAAAGKHVLLEKPMAADLPGAQSLVHAARGAGIVLLVNWPYAWWPPLQEALRLARSGAIGRVWGLRYRAAHAGPEQIGCSPQFCAWLFDESLNGGGAMFDYCCYGANLASLVLGLPDSLTASARNLCKPHLPVEDNATILLHYPRAQATLEGSWSQAGNLTSYVTVFYGETGTLLAEPHSGRLLLADSQSPDGRALEVPHLAPSRTNASRHFLSVIRGQDTLHPLCDPRHALEAQQILAAAKTAARESREIRLLPLI